MDAKELLKLAALSVYYDNKSEKDMDQYIANDEQYNKYVSLIEYCKSLESQFDCEIARGIFNPKFGNGCVEVIFHGEWAIDKKPFTEFANAIKMCDAINIAANPLGDDWVQVTFFINHIWKHI